MTMTMDTVYFHVKDVVILHGISGHIESKAIYDGATLLVCLMEDGSTRAVDPRRAGGTLTCQAARAREALKSVKFYLTQVQEAREHAGITELVSYPTNLPSFDELVAALADVQIP